MAVVHYQGMPPSGDGSDSRRRMRGCDSEDDVVDITKLPDNFIGKDDREHLEAFGGHTIARGRATRWRWARTPAGDDCFEMFAGGVDEHRVAHVVRDRAADCFRVFDADNRELVNGELGHIMAALEQFLAARHGELPDAPA